MRVTLAAIGKLKPGPERALFEHYAGRLNWDLTVREFDLRKPLPATERMAQESAWLLATVKDAEHIIALDERGKELSSVELAAHLRRQRDDGARHLACVIGGADGLESGVRARAHLLLSFGRVTWPHMLMRALLAEQLYRVSSIWANHPYHRE